MHEGAAAAGGDLLLTRSCCMPAIVMKITGEEDLNLSTKDFLFQEGQIVLVDFVVVSLQELVIDPMRFSRAQDDAIALLHSARYTLEVIHLRKIDVRVQLHIRPDQPPLVR